MANPDEIRKKIAALIKSKGLSYTQVSKKLGRGVAFMHQYITGRPLRLKEIDRKNLAQILEIDEQELTDIPLNFSLPNKLNTLENLFNINLTQTNNKAFFNQGIKIDIIGASSFSSEECIIKPDNIIGHWAIPLYYFHTISLTSSPEDIKMFRIIGDAMKPTLKEGDWVLVDISHRTPDSDGLYMLKTSTGLAVRRLQGSSLSDDITLISDNPIYTPETAKPADLNIFGRVIHTLISEKIG